MDLVDSLYLWTDRVVFVGLAVLRVWALIDCVSRKSAAFPAADKLTKPAWVAILLVAGLLGTVFGQATSPSNVVSILSLASVIVALIYLADVRPAVREMSG